MQRDFVSILLALLGMVVCARSALAQEIDFARDILPVFKAKCYECHGPNEQNGSFRIDDHTRKGDYVEDGDHEFSELYLMLVGEGSYSKMPPEDAPEQLTVAEIILIREWINQGAQWPEDVKWEEDANDKKETEDEEELTFWPKLWKEIGVLHPALLHFPIALLTIAGLFSLLALRGSLVMSDIAYACLWLGALGGLAASAVGWSYLALEGYPDLMDFDQKGYWNKTWVWHAWGGIIASVFAFILALIAAGYRRSDPEGGAIWKLGCILLAALIGLVGHFGGKMQYGTDFYDELLKTIGVMETEEPADNEEADENGADSDANKANEDDDASDGDSDNTVEEKQGDEGSSDDQNKDNDETGNAGGGETGDDDNDNGTADDGDTASK